MFTFFQNLFHNRSLGRLRQMLESLRSRDFSLQYSLSSLRGEERKLAQEINATVTMLREAEHQHERQVQFYESLLTTVPSMLIATDEKGGVKWMNTAAVNGLCGFRITELNQLCAVHPELPVRLRGLRKGSPQLLSFTNNGGEKYQYSAVCTTFFSKGFAYQLYALERVESVVQQSELEAQQNLVRVLNHEIMNSLTPIISLAQTISEGQDGGSELTAEEVKMALEAIHRRADGLLNFVSNYRKLSCVPQPVITEVHLGQLLADMEQLMQQLSETHSTAFSIQNLCEDTYIHIDRSQIEQVLINLLKNATESGATAVTLTIDHSPNGRMLQVCVSDNGKGFAPEALPHLFTPFFTTKQGGQGIGLALCKQIVNNHGGTLTAQSQVGGNTQFVVHLPK